MGKLIGILCDGVFRGKLERHAKGVVFFISRKEFFVSNCIRFEKWIMREKKGVILMSCMFGWLYRWERAGISKTGHEVKLVGGEISKCVVNAV